MKTIIYGLDDLLGVGANLYGFENIDFEKTKSYILSEFKQQYQDNLEKSLKSIGLKLHNIKYFSPKYYNYDGDTLEIEVSLVDKHLFKEHILFYMSEIQLKLKQNKSYDGYIALTKDSVYDELESIKDDNYTPDVIVLGTILRHYIDIDFEIHDHLVFDDKEE